MHPFLLLLGTAAVTYSQMLGHTLAAGAVAIVGGLLQALAKRAKIPVMRSLPTFAPAGSALSIALSVLFLVAGAVLIGIPIASTTQLGMAARIFFPVLGSGALMMFDTADLAGVTPPPTAVAVLTAFVLPFACAHVPPVTSCIEAKVGNRGPAIVAEVEADIAQSNWNDLLLALGPQLGWDVLSCVLDELETNSNPVVAARAKTFKMAHAAKLHGG